MRAKLGLALILLVSSVAAHAATIAVVDSGTDLLHPSLKYHSWFNPIDVEDAVDNDDNGLIDDVNGWNFAENNNKLVDRKLIGTFSADVPKFFEVQARMIRGIETPADREWLAIKRRDPAFIKELNRFGTFAHGTHVAGISTTDAVHSKIMGIKLLPTPAASYLKYDGDSLEIESGDFKDTIIKAGLGMLAGAQGKIMGTIGMYLKKQGAQVANCSFGSSTKQVQGVLKPLIEKILGRTPTDAEMLAYAKFFIGKTLEVISKEFIGKAPKTLFVIAAGNDGMDNDQYPASPANVRVNHAITVAATVGVDKLASFSNFGNAYVDIAAPGVGIRSSVPGNDFMEMSGTSQAAPFVASVAGKILDENPALRPVDVKTILMATVDKKGFLEGKVVSGGVVNPERAVMAASLTLSRSVTDAIEMAKQRITKPFEPSSGFIPAGGSKLADHNFVVELPSLIQ